MVCGYSWIFFASGSKPTSMRRALAERLADNEPVIIIDRPVSILREREVPSFKSRCNHLPGVEGCWHYRPLHIPERIPVIRKILRLLNRRFLRRELDQLLPRNANRVVCYDSPTQEHLVGMLGDDVSVYLAIDDRTLTVYGDPIPGELEAEKRLLGKVNRVICVSEFLSNTLKARIPGGTGLPIDVLPNAYDERLFDPNRKYMEPRELKEIPRPRILVAGHVSERIDWEAIIQVSSMRPQWTWVFVGPADSGMKERINSALGEHGFYHTPIPVTDVPAWIHHCDVCAVPYRLNPFTRASHPLKAIEYLAMGAPVLSTRIPSLHRYDGAIEWVNEGLGESHAKALDKLEGRSRNREFAVLRQQAVARDSWGVRVNHFREIVFNGIS